MMKKLTPERLMEAVGKHESWLANRKEGTRADLSNVDLSGLNMSKTDLRDVNFDGSNLSGVDLSLSRLDDASLCTANLGGAKLEGASLRDAFLQDANLREASLRQAQLKGADLSGADFFGCDLTFADLTFADLADTGIFTANFDFFSTWVVPGYAWCNHRLLPAKEWERMATLSDPELSEIMTSWNGNPPNNIWSLNAWYRLWPVLSVMIEGSRTSVPQHWTA